MDKYYEILKPNGELLIVIDDTILNGQSNQYVRDWILNKFVIIGVHSLPFNAFFKAKANIKTSILHLRKKLHEDEKQGHIFMSIVNNVGHDNSLRDTSERNNLNNVLQNYLEWKRTGHLEEQIKDNYDHQENLECPEQIWLLPPEELDKRRFDSFYYSPDLKQVKKIILEKENLGHIKIYYGKNFKNLSKLSQSKKKEYKNSDQKFKYIEIGDVTSYGLITSYQEGLFSELPSRGEYQVKEGDILLALNNSSRGTVVLVPKYLDNGICTSGFVVLRPKNKEEGLLLWYTLRSEACRRQIYYYSQTASQPELKLDVWKHEFMIPLPVGELKEQALNEAEKFQSHVDYLLEADKYRLNFDLDS